MNINWYPGHMAKTKRLIIENLKLVDAVVEITDARIPVSSRNPDLQSLTKDKPSLVILNRADQADAGETERWISFLRSDNTAALAVSCRTGEGFPKFLPSVRELLSEKLKRFESRGQIGRGLRLMVAGIPNVGKSSFINRLAKRTAAKAEDRPGVTRGKQWIKLDSGFELLDTPGILWPKIDDPESGLSLAFTGAVRDDILDMETLACKFLEKLSVFYPIALTNRYKLDRIEGEQGFDMLARAARLRGYLLSGAEPDTERMSRILLDEFRGGKLGRITLEPVPESRP